MLMILSALNFTTFVTNCAYLYMMVEHSPSHLCSKSKFIFDIDSTENMCDLFRCFLTQVIFAQMLPFFCKKNFHKFIRKMKRDFWQVCLWPQFIGKLIGYFLAYLPGFGQFCGSFPFLKAAFIVLKAYERIFESKICTYTHEHAC